MAFQASEIGISYDVGLATRPNPDGTTATLNCVDEDGTIKQLSQVAYMFATERGEQMESVDLIRKDQLVRLSSSNLIDREFTNYPQVTQGNWIGGELQRVFNDPTAYYQGRGLPWPTFFNAPGKPQYSTRAIAGQTGQAGVVAGGFYTSVTYGNGYVAAFQDAGGWKLRFQGGAASATSAALSGQPSNAVMALGQVYFVAAGSTQIQTMSTGAATIANFANPPIGTSGGLMAVGIVGTKTYLAVYTGTTGAAANQIIIYDAANAANFISIAVPAISSNLTIPVQTMTFLGSALVFAISDGFNSAIASYDIPSGLTTTLVSGLKGYTNLQIASVAGAIFVLGLYAFTVDCFLLTGSAMQFIGTLPNVLSGTNPIQYTPVNGFSNIATFGSMVAFCGVGSKSVIYVYDVQQGSLYTASDDLAPGNGVITNNMLTITSGFSTVTPQTPPQWTFVVQFSGGTLQLQEFTIGVPSTVDYGFYVSNSGRIISSAIDFTSASPKLYRQLLVDHLQIPAGGQVFIAIWLDQDVDTLKPVPDLTVTNTVALQTTTVIIINRMARKLVYLVDYTTPDTTHNAPRPKTVRIQSASGWIWKVFFAISDSAVRNGQDPQDYAFTAQSIDAKAAYNFLRQLWRAKGGLCIATYPNGDSFNAALESLEFRSPKPAQFPLGGDRRPRYEVEASVSIREDM